MKIPFYRRKLDEHGGPVLWIDADTRLLRAPEMLDGCRLDLVGFVGRLGYIRDFNPYDTARFWVPGVLFLNNTERGRAFVKHMGEIEARVTERITDDYVLHEAWTTFDRQMDVGFFSPETLVRTLPEAGPQTVFVYTASGNVREYRGSVRQHEGIVGRRERAKVLTACAADFQKAGDGRTALSIMRRAVEWNPDDLVAIRRFAWYLRLAGERDEAYAALEDFTARQPEQPEGRVALIKRALADRELDRARRHIEQLAGHADARWRAHARSLSFDLELEERAAARGTPRTRRTALWWMKGPYPGNFGDVLNPYVVEKLSGEPPVFVERPKGMLAIGSTIKFAGTGTLVWGSGTPRTTDTLAADADYRAVRGPLTRELVLRSGGSCPEVFGDPGLLLPSLYAPTGIQKRHAVGLIRHLNHGHLELRLDGVEEISVSRCGYDEIEDFVDEVLACDVILSTSLHGLITAHAYGVPARWCAFGEEPGAVPGDGTKFLDYFRSVGLPDQEPLDLSEFEVIDESVARHVDPRVELSFSAARLIEAFPV